MSHRCWHSLNNSTHWLYPSSRNRKLCHVTRSITSVSTCQQKDQYSSQNILYTIVFMNPTHTGLHANILDAWQEYLDQFKLRLRAQIIFPRPRWLSIAKSDPNSPLLYFKFPLRDKMQLWNSKKNWNNLKNLENHRDDVWKEKKSEIVCFLWAAAPT